MRYNDTLYFDPFVQLKKFETEVVFHKIRETSKAISDVTFKFRAELGVIFYVLSCSLF